MTLSPDPRPFRSTRRRVTAGLAAALACAAARPGSAQAQSPAPTPAPSAPDSGRKPPPPRAMGRIVFERGSPALDVAGASEAERIAAAVLALAEDRRRVQIVAFAGKPAVTESALRRLALERALAVRARLEIAGVPAIRIDLRAEGAAPTGDDGPPDRVDVVLGVWRAPDRAAAPR